MEFDRLMESSVHTRKNQHQLQQLHQQQQDIASEQATHRTQLATLGGEVTNLTKGQESMHGILLEIKNAVGGRPEPPQPWASRTHRYGVEGGKSIRHRNDQGTRGSSPSTRSRSPAPSNGSSGSKGSGKGSSEPYGEGSSSRRDPKVRVALHVEAPVNSREPRESRGEADEEDVEERIALAKLEADHAEQAARAAAARGVDPPTPECDFGHLPTQIREPMRKISEWVLTEEAHLEFSKVCNTERNKQMAKISDMFVRDRHITWVRYFNEMLKCKNFTQWKARLNALSCPPEGTLNLRTPMECGRLLALIFMKGLDVVPSADLKDRGFWISPEVAEWLG